MCLSSLFGGMSGMIKWKFEMEFGWWEGVGKKRKVAIVFAISKNYLGRGVHENQENKTSEV